MKAAQSMRIRMMAAAILGAGTLLAQAVPAGAAASEKLGPNIVANGGFEVGANPGTHLGVAAGSPYLTNWQIVSNEVGVVGTYWQPQEGARSLSLATTGPAASDPKATPPYASGVKQTLTTKAGQRYRVVFYQAGNPFDHQPSVLRLQIGNVTRDYTYQADATASTKKMQWVKRSLVFTAAAASTPLAFFAYFTPGNDPLGLDNVQVRAIQSTPIPVPAAGS